MHTVKVFIHRLSYLGVACIYRYFMFLNLWAACGR